MRLASRWSPVVVVGLTLGASLAPGPGRSQDAAASEAQSVRRSEQDLRRLLAGAWHLLQSEATARARIDGGIERAVSEMNYFLQGIARDQMRANTPLNRRIDIAFEGSSSITVTFDQRFTYTTRPGVAQQFPLPDGGSVQVRQYFRDGHFEQYFEAALGRRWNVYRLSDDGQTMTVSATQQGPLMPVPMHFSLDYRKRDAG